MTATARPHCRADHHRAQPHTLYAWTERAPHPAATARDHLGTALHRLGIRDESLHDALIMVSELVTNAVRYAPGPYQLRLRTSPAEHVIEVHDRGTILPLPPPAPDTQIGDARPTDCGGGADALLDRILEHGRGLVIVHQLSGGCCGFRTRPGGKTAWFALPNLVPNRASPQ